LQAPNNIQPAQAKSELRTIATHAGTVLVGQLATMGYSVADSIIAGRYASEALAVFAVGAAIYASAFVALMGVMQALMPIYAEAHGAGNPRAVGSAWKQSLYLAAIAIAVGMLVMLFPGPLLDAARVPQELQSDVVTYLRIQALTLTPAILFRGFSTLSQAIGVPKFVTVLQIASLPVKILLSVWFVWGGLGVPALGVQGCAVATLVVMCGMFAAAVFMMRTQAAYAPLNLLRDFEAPDWARIRHYARIGVPGGLAMLFEVTSFTLMAVLVARLGVVAAAAHQIAANTAAVLFMAPLSISIATSARVSFWIGAGEPAKARQLVGLGFKAMTGLSLLLAALLWLLAPTVARLYSNSPEVIAVAVTLLLCVCAYQLADAVQTLCVFLLRCYQVTIAPFVVYAIALWGLGLGGGIVLTYRGFAGIAAMQSPLGFWLAGVGAITLTALIFVAILWGVLRRLPLPAPAVPAIPA
jgi:multidrug resistance protein, MATE family